MIFVEYNILRGSETSLVTNSSRGLATRQVMHYHKASGYLCGIMLTIQTEARR